MPRAQFVIPAKWRAKATAAIIFGVAPLLIITVIYGPVGLALCAFLALFDVPLLVLEVWRGPAE